MRIHQSDQNIFIPNKLCSIHQRILIVKILSSTTVFNVDDNKDCLVNIKSAFKNDF